MDLNSVTITGRLTRDPEVQATLGGTAICKLGIAVNEYTKQGEEWVEYANYFDVTVFGSKAEKCGKELKKGSKVGIAGKLHYSSWEKEGQKRSKVDITANAIDYPPKPKQQAADDDIPF